MQEREASERFDKNGFNSSTALDIEGGEGGVGLQNNDGVKAKNALYGKIQSNGEAIASLSEVCLRDRQGLLSSQTKLSETRWNVEIKQGEISRLRQDTALLYETKLKLMDRCESMQSTEERLGAENEGEETVLSSLGLAHLPAKVVECMRSTRRVLESRRKELRVMQMRYQNVLRDNERLRGKLQKEQSRAQGAVKGMDTERLRLVESWQIETALSPQRTKVFSQEQAEKPPPMVYVETLHGSSDSAIKGKTKFASDPVETSSTERGIQSTRKRTRYDVTSFSHPDDSQISSSRAVSPKGGPPEESWRRVCETNTINITDVIDPAPHPLPTGIVTSSSPTFQQKKPNLYISNDAVVEQFGSEDESFELIRHLSSHDSAVTNPRKSQRSTHRSSSQIDNLSSTASQSRKGEVISLCQSSSHGNSRNSAECETVDLVKEKILSSRKGFTSRKEQITSSHILSSENSDEQSALVIPGSHRTRTACKTNANHHPDATTSVAARVVQISTPSQHANTSNMNRAHTKNRGINSSTKFSVPPKQQNGTKTKARVMTCVL